MFDTKSIAKQFRISGRLADIRPYGSGHIHDTYVVQCHQDGRCIRYILQMINHAVFNNLAAMMENIVRVTAHIRAKLTEAGVDDIERRVLTIVQTCNGEAYYQCGDGSYWRMYDFIEDGRSYDTIDSLEKIYEAARMFGNFQNMLTDLPGPPLHETIPGFHNGQRRFAAFQKALKTDTCNRAQDSRAEIDYLQKHSWIFDELARFVERGDIPVRITHNDTKVNNILFDNYNSKGLCVIDLDTVMPGLALHDFGDIVRTTISSASEDEMDLSKVTIDLSRFEMVVRGYLFSAQAFLNKTEINNLLLGAKTIALEQAVRFLTDHLAGDTYYKINRPYHNLDRTRTQIRLYELILEHENELNKIVNIIRAEL